VVMGAFTARIEQTLIHKLEPVGRGWLSLRASNEGLLSPRVARAKSHST
jgi:hypothetical protein